MPGNDDEGWRLLFRVGAICAFVVVVLVPIQVVFYFVWPPVFDAPALFETFEQNWFRGLESLDIFMLLDSVISVPIYLAIGVALWPAERSLVLLAVVAAIAAAPAYFSSNASLELSDLARQYTVASDPEIRTQLLAAGRYAVAHFQGTGFATYYVLGGIATVLIALAMLRTNVFGRPTGWVGIATGVTMLVPPGPATGQAGIVLSLASLAPLVVWLALTGRRLWRQSDTHLVVPR